MMTRQAYFEMKAAGFDVSDLANIYENTAESELLKLTEAVIESKSDKLAIPDEESGSITIVDKPEGYSEADIEAYKQKLMTAIKNREAGISKNPPHHIVLLSDEPDAIPIPYSSVFGNGSVRLKEIKEIAKPAIRPASYKPRYEKRSSLYKGSNYTAPKKKRKKH